MIDSLWNFEDPALSEQRFREHLASVAGQPLAVAETQSQLARAIGLQRRFDEAWAVLDEAEAAIGSDAGRVSVRLLLERGRVLNSSRRDDRGRACFEKAITAASQIGEENLAIDAAHMLGIILPGAEGREWNERTLAMAEAATDPRARDWRGPMYNNLGWAYHDQGDYARALTLFEKALDFRLEKGQVSETRIARWCLARCLRSLGRLDEALTRQQALLADFQAAGEQDGYVPEEIGECLLALGRVEEARPYFADAHRVLSADAWLTDHEAARLARLQRLAAGAR